MRFELFIADRYLRSKRGTGFISIITYISAAGVMIGVAALVIVLSVANGFESEVRDRIIGADSHFRITMFHAEPMVDFETCIDVITNIKEITGASPFVSSKGMLRKGKAVEGSLIKGIDEKSIGQVSDLPLTIVAGSLNLTPLNMLDQSGSTSGLSSLPGIILGRQLSFRLGAAVGDSVIALSPTGMTSMFSSPEIKRFVVTGIFETGIFEYDNLFSYISLESAQELFNMKGGVSGLELRINEINQTEFVKQKIEDVLGYPYYIQSWHDLHRTLFRWMKLEKWLYTILLSLIILVAAFNIVSSQIMIVLEKRREIGILKAIGGTREEIMRIFLFEGLIVGIIGTTLGIILGWAVCWGQLTFQWFSLPGDVYFLNQLPIKMQTTDFVIISIVSMILTILATVYPAKRAGSLDPVDAIRY